MFAAAAVSPAGLPAALVVVDALLIPLPAIMPAGVLPTELVFVADRAIGVLLVPFAVPERDIAMAPAPPPGVALGEG